MTSINDMNLPDDVMEKVARALATHDGWQGWDTATSFNDTPSGNDPDDEKEGYRARAAAAIRATLQVMVDCGMAKSAALSVGSTDGPEDDSWEARSGWSPDKIFPPCLIIRLDNADEQRKDKP